MSVFKEETDKNIIDKKNILVNWSKYKPPNIKECQELFDKLKQNPSFTFMDFGSTQDIIDFINTNKSHYLSLIFPMTSRFHNTPNIIKAYKEMMECINYIKTISDTNMNFYFIPQDVFGVEINIEWLKTVYSAQSNTIKIIMNLTDLDDYASNVGDFTKPFPHPRGKLHPIKNPNDILFWPANYAYSKSFIPFNENPIIKIALSGSYEPNNPHGAYNVRAIIQQKLTKYPTLYERIHPNRNERLPKNSDDPSTSFSLKLNKYLANIWTCAFNYKKSLLLLKLYEILASGSLLIIPLDHKLICNKLNLIENVHYKVINFNNETDMLSAMNYILSPTNRTEIDTIRRQGQDFCKENLNAEWGYNNFIKLFD